MGWHPVQVRLAELQRAQVAELLRERLKQGHYLLLPQSLGRGQMKLPSLEYGSPPKSAKLACASANAQNSKLREQARLEGQVVPRIRQAAQTSSSPNTKGRVKP